MRRHRFMLAGCLATLAAVDTHAGPLADPLLAPAFCQVAPLAEEGALNKASAAYAAGRAREAVALLEGLVGAKSGPDSGDVVPGLELLARSYKVIGCDDRAIDVQQRHLALVRERGDAGALCRSQSRLARLRSQRDAQSAEQLALIAIDCGRAGGDRAAVAESLTTLGGRRFGESRFAEAEELLGAAIETAPTPLLRAEALRFRGVLRSQRLPLALPDAIEDFKRSAAEAEAARDPEALTVARLYLADLRLSPENAGLTEDERRDAARELAAAAAAAERSGMRRIGALAANLVGRSQASSEAFGQARTQLARALDLYKAVGDDVFARAVALDLANLLWQLGKEYFDEAERAASESRRLALRSGYPFEAAKADHILGLIALDRGNAAEAKRLLRSYLAQAETNGTESDRARVLNDIARAELHDQDLPAAIEHAERAAQYALRTQDRELQSAIDVTLGWALDRDHRALAAEEAFYHALAHAPARGGGLRRVAAYWGLGRAEARARRAVAIAYYKAAARELEAVVRDAGASNVLGANVRPFEAFGGRYSDMYRELAALLIEDERPFEAQRVSDLMQQQELREKQWLKTRAVMVKGGAIFANDDGLLACQGPMIERTRDLLREREALASTTRACCDAAASAGSRCHDPPESTAACTQLRAIAEKEKRLQYDRQDCLEEVQRRLGARAPSDAEAVLQSQFQAQWQRATRNDRVTLVLTLVKDEELDVLVATRPFTGFEWQRHALRKGELQAIVDDIRQSMRALQSLPEKPAAAVLAADAARLRAGALRKLHDLLIAPFGRKSLGADPSSAREGQARPVLAFSLDGVLRGVPIAALFDGERYLSDDFALAIVTPQTVIDPGRVDTATQGLIMGVSATDPPLPAVRTEIEGIARLLHLAPYLDDRATKSELTTWIQRLDAPALALHVASHGVFGGTRNSTRLKLWHDDEIDGDELERLQLKLNYVRIFTLSACDTAQSLDDLGFGLAGIAAGGARTVVGSLWNVADDSTAMLMHRFYQRLTTRAGAAEALRDAQLATRETYPHPFYWAPFILVGRWD